MAGKNTAVLIDSDVILDYFFDRKPYSEESEKLLYLAEEGKLKGYITPVIISNLYYILRKSGSHTKVINSLRKLLEVIDILSINKTIINEALYSNFKDFEDAIQNYSAEQSGVIKAIITRNIKDYKESEVSIFSPKTFLRTFNVD